MAVLRTTPTTKDSVSVASALERETDLTPFDFEHKVGGSVLYGLYQDLNTNGPVVPLVISAVKDQDGKPMLLTRSSNRDEGVLKTQAQAATDNLGAGTPGNFVFTFTVPAGKIWCLKMIKYGFTSTSTVTAIQPRVGLSSGATMSIAFTGTPTVDVNYFWYAAQPLWLKAGESVILLYQNSADTSGVPRHSILYAESDL